MDEWTYLNSRHPGKCLKTYEGRIDMDDRQIIELLMSAQKLPYGQLRTSMENTVTT